MRIIILIFTLFITQSMFTKIFNSNGHNKAQNLQWLSDEHLIVADNLLDMEYYKNYSLEDLTTIYDGVEYKEEWKNIQGYEGLYKVSNFGRVKSLCRQKGFIPTGKPRFYKEKIIETGLSNKKYIRTTLCDNTKIKSTFVHILVAKEFVNNIGGKPKVNHKDGVKINNFYKNLEWVTSSENTIHAYRILNRKMGWNGNKGELSINARKVNQFDKQGNFIKTHGSLTDAAKEMNGTLSNLSYCLSGKTKTAFKFKWEYA